MASQLIEFACGYAQRNHEGQMYGSRNYTEHLFETYNVALRFGFSEDIQAACWLHDILEDTERDYANLKLCFGEKIAEIVYCVTDELGRDREEKKSKTYPKIASNQDAIKVKLCDRIANIEACIKDENRKMLLKYSFENRGFIDNLYFHGENPPPIWQHYFNLLP